MPGSAAHLTSRFFDVATSRRLSASEEAAVSVWLSPELGELFFAQARADQRHGYEAALIVLGAGVKEREVVAAALLHDIGKRHAHLGLWGRTVASMLIRLGLPLTERMRAYRDHGLVAARELAALGAPSLVIDFAMHHHGERPATIGAATWEVLLAADQPPKPLSAGGRRITSAVR